MKDDPVLARIHEVRRRIWDEVGRDPERLLERYKKLQERHEDRLVRNVGVKK